MNALTPPGASLRARVIHLAKLNLPADQIAFTIGLSPRTLQLFFSDELKKSSIPLNLRVLETLAYLAISGKSASATIVWAKTHGLLRQTANSLPNVSPMPPFIIAGPNGERLEDDDE